MWTWTQRVAPPAVRRTWRQPSPGRRRRRTPRGRCRSRRPGGARTSRRRRRTPSSTPSRGVARPPQREDVDRPAGLHQRLGLAPDARVLVVVGVGDHADRRRRPRVGSGSPGHGSAIGRDQCRPAGGHRRVRVASAASAAPCYRTPPMASRRPEGRCTATGAPPRSVPASRASSPRASARVWSRRRLIRYLVQADLQEEGRRHPPRQRLVGPRPAPPDGRLRGPRVGHLRSASSPTTRSSSSRRSCPGSGSRAASATRSRRSSAQERLIKQIQFPKIVLPVAATFAGHRQLRLRADPARWPCWSSSTRDRITPVRCCSSRSIAVVQLVFTLALALVLVAPSTSSSATSATSRGTSCGSGSTCRRRSTASRSSIESTSARATPDPRTLLTAQPVHDPVRRPTATVIYDGDGAPEATDWAALGVLLVGLRVAGPRDDGVFKRLEPPSRRCCDDRASSQHPPSTARDAAARRGRRATPRSRSAASASGTACASRGRPPCASPSPTWSGAHDGTKAFWALRDVSFRLVHGESLAVIGPNGAGKSTLLQVLAGILTPSEGAVEVRGQISSLLTLGAGFDQDLTGRENILLAGAFLGIDDARSRRRPGRSSSSPTSASSSTPRSRPTRPGMRARLGFSIATSVDPDMLLLDEVLATGDQVFRAK